MKKQLSEKWIVRSRQWTSQMICLFPAAAWQLVRGVCQVLSDTKHAKEAVVEICLIGNVNLTAVSCHEEMVLSDVPPLKIGLREGGPKENWWL